MFTTSHDKNTYSYFKYDPNAPLTEKLPSGVYDSEVDMYGMIHFKAHPIQTDGLVQLHQSVASEVLGEVDFFFSPEVKKRFNERNIMHRRGILMYGPQGTGKSCTIYQLIELLITKDVVILYEPYVYDLSKFIAAIRAHDPERHILVIWEEFDDLLERHEKQVLQLLDGAESVNNIIFVATTNYIDEIPGRIRNRPSRFARLIEVSYPDAEGRREFLMSKMHPDDLKEQDIDLWVESTEGMVIDHMKELITSVCCLSVPFKEAVERLREMNEYDDDEYEDSDEHCGELASLRTKYPIPDEVPMMKGDYK